MSEKNISECLQCQFQKGRGKCCEERGYGILASTGSWKQLESMSQEKEKGGGERLLAQFMPIKKAHTHLHILPPDRKA